MSILKLTREEIAARLGKQFKRNFTVRTTEAIQADLLELQPYVEKIYRLREELNQARAVDTCLKVNTTGNRSIQDAAT